MTRSDDIDDIMERAQDVKVAMDGLTKLGDSLYVCMDCGQVSGYWKPGMVCESCEAKGEQLFEEGREHEV